MLTCENCGATFAPPEKLTEVTSLRVLCPRCAAERAAAKARLATAAPIQGMGSGGPTRGRSDAAPRPAAAKPVRPAPGAPPPPNRRPAPAPARPAAQKSEAKPARKAPPHHVDPEQVHRQIEKKGTRETVLAFGVAALVVLVAGGVLWKVLGTKKAERAVEQARIDRIEGFRRTFAEFDIQTEDGARKLIDHAEQNKVIWAEADFAGEVVSRVAKAKTFLEGLEERRTLEQRLTDIEQGLARAAELQPTELAELRRRLEELDARAGIGGSGFIARVAKDRAEAERVYIERLMTSAQAAAAADPLDRAALSTIQLAEDELLKIFETSYRAWQKNAQDPEVTARKDEHQALYQEIIRLSDQSVERVFTPEVIEAMPWRDLLAADQVSHWKWAELKGFEHRIENGVLHLIGPDPSEKSEGIGSVGDREVWRDFVLDMEFTIVKGGGTMFFRLPLVWQENVESVELSTDEGQLEPERSYEYVYSLIGSTFVEESKSEDSVGPRPSGISWAKVRKGAFSISIPKDSEIKFTRLRAKVLR